MSWYNLKNGIGRRLWPIVIDEWNNNHLFDSFYLIFFFLLVIVGTNQSGLFSLPWCMRSYLFTMSELNFRPAYSIIYLIWAKRLIIFLWINILDSCILDTLYYIWILFKTSTILHIPCVWYTFLADMHLFL